ncbi:MAG TPA: sigma-70 family RNA polymerase sigma factor, partial [Myxococcota bacterium]|nr:sigma-70 family RNA polymerase sigma factor [Myxococcota bacterium]
MLFGLLYRLTGSFADAEDLVQSTFERALERPPPETDRPWRPWLVRVAMNLGRDHLRRRRRRRYDGPWLPAPMPTPDMPSAEEESGLDAPEPWSTQGRYELMESVSYAFLLALEELTPSQRAVLLLRDVFDYSGRETAEALELSEPGVRQHLR